MISIEQIKQQIADLTQQLHDAERSQIMIPNWEPLINDLNKAGMSKLFAEIAYQASQTPNPPDRILEAEALGFISACHNASIEADRIGVIGFYLALMGLAQEIISPGLEALILEILPKLQQVLDDRKIPKSMIAFIP